jgi:hypothetical protein
MAFSHGKDSVTKVADSADLTTADDISAYVTNVSMPRDIDTAEVSAQGDEAKKYVVGMQDATFSIEGVWDPTIDARLAGLVGKQDAAWSYTPQVAGPVYSGVSIMTSYETSGGIGDAIQWKAEFQVSGAVTRT